MHTAIFLLLQMHDLITTLNDIYNLIYTGVRLLYPDLLITVVRQSDAYRFTEQR